MSKNGFTQIPSEHELNIELMSSDDECLSALTLAIDTARVQNAANENATKAQTLWQDALENRGRILDALSGLPYKKRKPIKTQNVHVLPVTEIPVTENLGDKE